MTADLTAQRHEWIEAEIRWVLRSGKWQDSDAVVAKVCKRWMWAAWKDVWSALSDLWDRDEVDQRHVDRETGPGSVEPVRVVTQWRLLPGGKAKIPTRRS